jgi:hypothetical protein
MTDLAVGVPRAAGAGQAPEPRVLDVARVRADFPILRRQVRGRPLVYLDNAATTQKPQAVLDAITSYYTTTNANVHRGVHLLSQLATEAHDAARLVQPRDRVHPQLHRGDQPGGADVWALAGE